DVNNVIGPDFATISVPGTGAVAVSPDTEDINVLAGAGADTFRVDSFTTGNNLHLFGRGGADRLQVTPTNRNLHDGITNIGLFEFFGGPGGDTFELFNQNSPDLW